MATAKRATKDELMSLEVGRFMTICPVPQGGALQARKLSSGAIQFYWRYTAGGKTDRVPIGVYDSSAPPKQKTPTAKGFGQAAAVEWCAENAQLGSQTPGGYRAHKVQAEEARAKALTQVQEAGLHTLEALLTTYVSHLKAKGRSSHRDVRSIFRLHIIEPFPDLANRPASALTSREVTDLMRRLTQDDKGRTANKLRAYLGAAYQCAMDVNSLASIPVAFRPFAISINPATATKRDASHDRSAKAPLTKAEMRNYWQLIQGKTGTKAAALCIHLLTGGQRIEQLVRLKASDMEAERFAIFDGKGRPGQAPRRHTVPLLDTAKPFFDTLPKQGDTWRLKDGTEGPATYVLSTDGGRTHISSTTLSNWAQEIVGTSIPNFQLKRIRSGVETLLASVGTSQETRGHLQSHGLTGVQHKHYDAHDYLPEKRRALEELHRLFTSEDQPPC